MSAAGEKKVVVTGLGVVSGVGTGVAEFWEGLLAGESSINRIERFDPAPFKCQIGSEVNFLLRCVNPHPFLYPCGYRGGEGRKGFSHYSRTQQLSCRGRGSFG